jgi:hypothetical protein
VSALLIISIFLLAAASYSIIRSKRTTTRAEGYLPDPRPRSLFAGADEDGAAQREAKAKADAAERDRILARAARGNLEALAAAAATRDASLYRLALEALVSRAQGQAELSALSSYVVGHNLRACPSLALKLLEGWEARPARESVPELLRIAALSDDAGVFSRAVADVFAAWEAGRAGGLSAHDLRALFDAEYWLLSSEAKRSGAGFHLKQQLSDVRRRLSRTPRREDPTSGGAGRGPAAQ